jgi:DNA-directed RNA polymerase specialized sigma24 family protein
MRRFEDPEDVCQEVILQVWRRRCAGTEVRSSLGFARKLAHDRSVDVRRRPELEIVDLPELDELEIDRSEPGPYA